MATVKRQAVYKAIHAGRLTMVLRYGKMVVQEDQKLRDFVKAAKLRKRSNGNGNKG